MAGWRRSDGGAVQFNIFFPSAANSADPRITSVRVPGTFQPQLGSNAWDWTHAPQMSRSEMAEGTLWTYTTPVALAADFYEYKYLVTFESGDTRCVAIRARATAARTIRTPPSRWVAPGRRSIR